MKIFYTKEFKKRIELPYKKLKLSKFKLRTGTTDFKELKSDNLKSNFLNSAVPTNEYYSCNCLKYDSGIQLSLNIPSTDQSIYGKKYHYQIILIFCEDVTIKDEDPDCFLAFILFENSNINKGTNKSSSENIEFKDLKLNTLKNIITIPDLSWKCDILIENDNEFVQFLESEYGQDIIETKNYFKVTNDETFCSTESVESYHKNIISDTQNQNYLETIYLNKFGIKIY